MLKTIKEILQNIGDFFVSVGAWFVDFIEDCSFFFKQLSSTVSDVTEIIGDLFPEELVAPFIALLTIVVVLRILGRD